jgi:hypothetical protein
MTDNGFVYAVLLIDTETEDVRDLMGVYRTYEAAQYARDHGLPVPVEGGYVIEERELES